ncbi:MAG TPA: PAS domain S-box protein [Blastocatellia bacterium]|nr:PAS domain S-box protein [Blastocatellia bacterium]
MHWYSYPTSHLAGLLIISAFLVIGSDVHAQSTAALQDRVVDSTDLADVNLGRRGNVVGTPALGRITSTRFPTGESGSPRQIQLVFANSASVPIYGVASWQVGKGIVGGYLRDMETDGARAADVALRITSGNLAQNIPIESIPVKPMFDWRELKRWGISETSLPPGSVVRFRMPSFWDQYKWYAIAAISLIVFQSALIVGLVISRTRRKRAEEAMRESEERFRNMADTAPVMIWVSNPNKLCTYFNKQWLDFTGRSIKDELGNGWTECIDPDDYHRCLQTYNNACDRREPFSMEYRRRRADGESRLVLDSGIPRLSPSGEFLGYIGSAIDITERKAAEWALRDLSGQLIHAREDECARIARELHDDLNQRVALVSLELDHLSQNPPQSKAELRELIRQIINQAADLSTEIHRMSHDLHPSKLAQLGLVAALKSLCSELSASYGLSIELNCVDVPAALPKDVSICLYRIVQESLNNVVRHSGAEEAEVELRGTEQQVTLRVEDTGKGFEIESARSNKGLGLISMRERLRLVGGTMTIETGMCKGTRIEVRVPLGQKG